MDGERGTKSWVLWDAYTRSWIYNSHIEQSPFLHRSNWIFRVLVLINVSLNQITVLTIHLTKGAVGGLNFHSILYAVPILAILSQLTFEDKLLKPTKFLLLFVWTVSLPRRATNRRKASIKDTVDKKVTNSSCTALYTA